MSDLFAECPRDEDAKALEQRGLQEVQRLRDVIMDAVQAAGTGLESDVEYGAALLAAMHSVTGVYAVAFKPAHRSLTELLGHHGKLLTEEILRAFSFWQKGGPHG